MLSEILGWVEKYGTDTAFILLGAAILYGLYDKYLSYFFSRKLRKERNEDINERGEFVEKRKNDLKNQEFFSNIHFKMNVDILTEDFSKDHVRSELFRDILVLLFKCYYDSMANFIKVVDPNWDKDQWTRALNKEIIKVVEIFKERAIVENIPPEAIERFLLWYSPYIQQIYFYIRKIREMGNRNAIENTSTFLLLLELILTNVMSDIQKYSVFNGKLDGLEYKGNVIGEQ
jgi:hypothetical protein